MRSSTLLSAAVAAAALASMGATDCGQIIDDAGFDLWCGDQLCKWDLDAGQIQRAATWHESDAGVELLGSDTKISQHTDVDNLDGTCIRFEMIADLDDSVDLRLQMDVYDDLSYEYDERIPAADWRALSYLVRMPSTYAGVRFRLYKRSAGHAVLANIGAEIAPDSECTSPPLVVNPPRVAPAAPRSSTWSAVDLDDH